jgi:DNA invertase Pin-like site-specific DNA recombinase
MNAAGQGRAKRCAIYTRKSTDEGLDQVFNTLDAQREACEAYVKSQAGEGWQGLAQRYDDGGFSGGNMNRPAIQQLLADVDAGRVDVIVVYKVDRLTRSLMDFSSIVQRLDARGVSFVSVTQAFNTTSSMGRLTLNMLLTFAQFEREVTGERIRDKVAASKAKGMWMGGNLPLGYDLGERKLVINEAESAQVRHIFARYLELGSAVELMRELRAVGVVSKQWTARSGRQMGGVPLGCGGLYYILQNRLYLGEVVHRGASHDGEHVAIISRELFEKVEQALARNRRARCSKPTRNAQCPLAGRVVDADAVPRTTSFSYGRRGKRYRYYVSPDVLPATKAVRRTSAVSRVPAAALERLVLDAVGRVLGAREPLPWPDALAVIRTVEVHQRSLQLILDQTAVAEPHEPLDWLVRRLQERLGIGRVVSDQDGSIRMIIDRAARFRGGAASAYREQEVDHASGALASLWRSAHDLLQRHYMSPLYEDAHHAAEAPRDQRHRRTISLGLLAPSLQKQLANGSLGAEVDTKLLLQQMPLAWEDQAALIRS